MLTSGLRRDIVGTLSVLRPGTQIDDDHRIRSAQLIEFTDGNDDTPPPKPIVTPDPEPEGDAEYTD